MGDTPIVVDVIRDGYWDDHLATMDPEREASAMVRIMVDHLFPIDTLLSSEIGQLRTFAVPRISRLLHRTGQYEASAKRLDDTRALLTEILHRDPATPDYDALVGHLNDLHGFYDIHNDDFIYTLSVLFMDLDVWMERFGRRPLRDLERHALLNHHLALAKAMKIHDVPSTWGEMLAWREVYQDAQLAFDEANVAVTHGALRWIAAMLPSPLGKLMPELVATWMGPRFARLLGLDYPSMARRVAIEGFMRARRVADRYVDPFRHTALTRSRLYRAYPTYPQGYDPMQLGPTKLVSALRARRCPVAHA